MAWVHVVPEEQAHGELKEAYERVRAKRGRVANVVKVSGALPGVMEAGIEFYVALMYGKHKLPRAQREMVAVEVSRANRCEYCVEHHGAALARVLRDEHLARRFMQSDSGFPLTPKDRAMLAYARKLTLTPGAMGPADVEALHKAGFDDEEAIAINHITAYFSMMNRVVHGLGVELEPDKGGAPEYKY